MGTNWAFVREKRAQSRVQGSGRWERKSASFLQRDGERKSLRFRLSRVLLFTETGAMGSGGGEERTPDLAAGGKHGLRQNPDYR